ncbi:MAG: LuxR C-terminal-related transcriptional regulator [Streptosporangiaceae bacterium]
MPNLPEDLTGFVGRRNELIQLRKMIESSRLTTLTGVGGVGKTRLALQVARQVKRAFRDGVHLIELDGLDDPSLLTQTVCAALGVTDPGESALLGHVAKLNMMIVLDNCEHLLEPCAVLVDRMLRNAPGLHFLLTSRQSLGIGGEHIFYVSPLSIPAGETVPGSVRDLLAYEAVGLFVERARAAVPEFEVTEDNRAAVSQLCQRLDGIPLAIELAAVRLRMLSPSEIVERLNDRFRFLSLGHGVASPRQVTLSALVSWSFDLLSDREQLLWAQLSIFTGSFDLASAEAVCVDSGLSSEEFLCLLIALVDKSILIREGVRRQGRYRLLETLKQFGRDRLAEFGGETGLHRRHCDHYLRLSETVGATWFGPDQQEWITRIRAEQGNLRAAMEFCLSPDGNARIGLRIVSSLWFYWTATGFLSEGRRWLDQLLRQDAPTGEVRAIALCTGAWMAAAQGDFAAACRLLAECRPLVVGRDDPSWAYARHVEGLVTMLSCELPRALSLFEDAMLQHRKIRDVPGLVNDLVELGALLAVSDEPARAAAFLEEALELCEQSGELWLKSYALAVLAILAWQKNDLAEALALALEGVRLKRVFNDQVGIALCLAVLAWIASSRGDHLRAAVLFGALQQIWKATNATMFANLIDYHETAAERSRLALGAKAFQAAFQSGRDETWDRILDGALGDEEIVRVEVPAAEESAVQLTRREREVAELIAGGRSDKEIAAKLIIAQRTAEGHVQRLLRKLDLTNRAQVAVWVVEQRVTGQL